VSAGTVAHQPHRPSWDCDTCGKPWPCDPARERLISEGTGPSLAILMWGHLEDAVLELPETPSGEVFDRFLAWTRPAAPAP
jgi:hypothetical protein